MKFLGYYVHKDDKELNARTVMVFIDEGHPRLTCFCPFEGYSEADRGYFDECLQITKDEYLKASKGFYTPDDYLQDYEVKQKWIDDALETKEYIDEPLEVSWLDAVPFDKDGNPTGEKNEWVIHRESHVIVDGLSELRAYCILDELQGICEE